MQNTFNKVRTFCEIYMYYTYLFPRISPTSGLNWADVAMFPRLPRFLGKLPLHCKSLALDYRPTYGLW